MSATDHDLALTGEGGLSAQEAKTVKPEAMTLEEAALAYAAAKADVDGHVPPYRGPEFAAKLSRWRGALLDLDAAALRAARERGQAA